MTRALGPPRMVATGEPVVVPAGSRVLALAGIARPERFFSDLAACGWHVVRTISARDHSRFTTRLVTSFADEAKAGMAAIILTTEKDAVRLAACDLRDIPIASVPLLIDIEPAQAFREWLIERVEA
jgi:tetraacyldisaccharide-1-P 4'-kinase